MKFLMRFFLGIQVGLYRLTQGRIGGRMFTNKVLLLTTTGRKSGKSYTTPLGFFDWQGGYIIVASNGGAAVNPGWFYNLKSSLQVNVQIMDKMLPVTGEILSGEARSQAWQQVITTTPMYAGYEKRTKREIPLVLLRSN